ncbi:hypothetical protein [Rhodococcus sp. T2V]|uniref:hypothetical protein n=1 Tax=Rhodococcus sp. T2V TaxID=3034164 RepID=UPI0031FE8021
MIDPVTGEIIDQKDLAERLLAQAKEQGVSLLGLGGLLNEERARDGVERGADRASRPPAWRDAGRSEHAQQHPDEDGAYRDRDGRSSR